MDMGHAGDPGAYDILAHFYRQLLEPRGHFAKQFALLRFIIENEAMPIPLRILDAACGTGDVAALLYENGFCEIEAIDGSQTMIAQRHLGNPVPMRHVLWTNLRSYFSEHGTYDLIFLLGNSLAHAPVTQIPSILASLYEGLKAGGVLLFDLRAWEKNTEGLLVEPDRSPSVYRCLGRIESIGESFWLYDRVEYDDLTQQVTYRLQPVKSDKQYSGVIETHVTYYIFDYQSVTEMLSSVGFHRSCVEARSVPSWPYFVIVARKTEEQALAFG